MFVFVLISFPLVIGSPGVSAQEGDILILATGLDDLITLDPGRAFETTNLTIHHATYDTLLEIRPDDLTTVVPGLAESYEVSEDGLVYTFKLREGVVFASGNPVTAEDVRFSWTRLINLKGNPSFYADPIASIEVVDDLTVRVTLKEPFPAFPSVVTAPAMSILDSALVKAHGGTDAPDADQTDMAKDWLDQNSAGSGPFVLTGWVPNSEVTLVRNENYWREPPAFAGVKMRDVNDSTTALQLLERGDVDITNVVDRDLAQMVRDNPDLVLEIGQTLNLNYIAMSPSTKFEPPLWDQRVRQAIAYAIDYDGIINELLQGFADRPAAMLPLGIQGSDPALRYERDLDRARALLAEAGYADGFALTLNHGTGTPGGIPIETFSAKLAADLAEIGITLNIVQEPTSNFLTAWRAQELQFVFSGWTPDYLDATMWSDYFSYGDRGPGFRVMMDSPTIAELATRGAFEVDREARTAIYRQYQEAHVAEAIFIPLFQPQDLYAMRADIQGFTFHPVYFLDFATLNRAG